MCNGFFLAGLLYTVIELCYLNAKYYQNFPVARQFSPGKTRHLICIVYTYVYRCMHISYFEFCTNLYLRISLSSSHPHLYIYNWMYLRFTSSTFILMDLQIKVVFVGSHIVIRVYFNANMQIITVCESQNT